MSFFDTLETRSAEERAADLAQALPEQIPRAKGAAGYAGLMDRVDPAAVTTARGLDTLPGRPPTALVPDRRASRQLHAGIDAKAA